MKKLGKMGIAMGGITTKDIMLTPDGEIQFYPHKLRIDNSHAVFFKVIKNVNDISLAYLPPEQLSHLRKASFILPDLLTTLISGDIFCIGMILLECIAFESSDKYYSVGQMNIKMESIKIKIRQLRENRIVSNGLMDFVEKCLVEDGRKRMTLEEADGVVKGHPKSRNLTFIAQGK